MLALGVALQVQKEKTCLEKVPQHGSKEFTHHWCRCKGFGFCKVERGHMYQDGFRVSSTGGMFSIALLHSFWLLAACVVACFHVHCQVMSQDEGSFDYRQPVHQVGNAATVT